MSPRHPCPYCARRREGACQTCWRYVQLELDDDLGLPAGEWVLRGLTKVWVAEDAKPTAPVTPPAPLAPAEPKPVPPVAPLSDRCRDCKLPRADWALTTGGHVRGGRSLCRRCWNRHKFNRTLDQFPRSTWHRDELLDTWVFLRDNGCDVETAALRIGVTRAALKRALHRAKARGDKRAVGFTKFEHKQGVVKGMDGPEMAGKTARMGTTPEVRKHRRGLTESQPEKAGARMAECHDTHTLTAPASESLVA